ncbi:MAG TPA: PIN domain-containing protein [Polyangiaceae bacterium]|jgi:tRNA(fMet)-specific endonuclease VapC
MTLRYLLDTGVVAEPVTRDPDADVLKRLRKRGGECAIAAPVWQELLLAVESLPAGTERRAIVERYLQEVVRPSFPVLPYDDAAAAWDARERARRAKAGGRVGVADGQIAAIAVTAGLALVTTSPKEFAGYPGLRVESWKGR